MNIIGVTFLILNIFTLATGGFVNYLSSLLPACVVQLFRYGRANVSDAKSSFVKAIEVPKRWFWHFYTYAVLLQFAVLLAVISTYSRNSSAPNSWLVNVLSLTGKRDETVSATATVVASTLFLIHLCRRLYETLCVCVYSNTKMNVLHYLLGYIHYTGTIFALVAHSPFFSSQSSIKKPSIPNEIGVFEASAVILLLLGNYLQNQAHTGLANLRKGKFEDKIEATGHKIPRGGMFELVSCPNYFAEILIYCALSALHGFQNQTLNFCLFWVICNQVTAGIMNHKWYQETFAEYPPERRAIIPYVL